MPTTQVPGQYLEAACDSEYVWDMGIVAAPVAGPPGAPCEVARLHAPMCYRVVTFHYERVGTEPEVPAPVASDNEVLVRVSISPPAPGLMPGGVGVYTTRGRYVFLCLVPPQIAVDALARGKLPLDPAAAETNYMPPSVFNPAHAGKPPPVSGSPGVVAPKLG